LKRALTRKGEDPNAGLASLCHAEDLFERASDVGVRDIEIVLVTSPVIETGNDLDFDWAILDPISTRSVIQAAGRVWRHRPVSGIQTNVLILGRSPIAIQTGELAMPGVETKASRETGVSTPSLSDFERRLFSDLVGDTNFSVIDARPILARDLRFPLRDAEIALREKFITADTDKATAPLGRYIRHVAARMTQRMPRIRRFRRSDTRSILFKLVGDDFGVATWYLDLSPGTRTSALQPVSNATFSSHKVDGWHLFDAITQRAWQDLAPGQDPTPQDVGRVMQVEIPDYGDDPEPTMTYTEFSGFTRGSLEALSEPFGKVTKDQ
jgi:CRISPR-associated endonuclease/helicase Cas3